MAEEPAPHAANRDLAEYLRQAGAALGVLRRLARAGLAVSGAVSGTAWAVCKAPAVMALRVLVYAVTLVFWPAAASARFVYGVARAMLFPRPLVDAAGPLYFFFFIGISIGVAVGVCIGVSSKILQLILDVSGGNAAAAAAAPKPQPEPKPANSSPRRAQAGLEEHSLLQRYPPAIDTDTFEFDSSSDPLAYIAVMPDNQTGPLSQFGHPPTILEEEEEEELGDDSELIKVSRILGREFADPAKEFARRPGLNEYDVNVPRQRRVLV